MIQLWLGMSCCHMALKSFFFGTALSSYSLIMRTKLLIISLVDIFSRLTWMLKIPNINLRSSILAFSSYDLWCEHTTWFKLWYIISSVVVPNCDKKAGIQLFTDYVSKLWFISVQYGRYSSIVLYQTPSSCCSVAFFPWRIPTHAEQIGIRDGLHLEISF